MIIFFQKLQNVLLEHKSFNAMDMNMTKIYADNFQIFYQKIKKN